MRPAMAARPTPPLVFGEEVIRIVQRAQPSLTRGAFGIPTVIACKQGP